MALQLRRLLPHGYAHRAVTLATKPLLPPAPAMVITPFIRLPLVTSAVNWDADTCLYGNEPYLFDVLFSPCVW
jgi:hypothetical protein